MSDNGKWSFEVEDNRDRIYLPNGGIFVEWPVEPSELGNELEAIRDTARKLILAMNMHDGLVAACEKSNGSASNILANLEAYKSMTPDQLRFAVTTLTGLLTVICTCTESALAENTEAAG